MAKAILLSRNAKNGLLSGKSPLYAELHHEVHTLDFPESIAKVVETAPKSRITTIDILSPYPPTTLTYPPTSTAHLKIVAELSLTKSGSLDSLASERERERGSKNKPQKSPEPEPNNQKQTAPACPDRNVFLLSVLLEPLRFSRWCEMIWPCLFGATSHLARVFENGAETTPKKLLSGWLYPHTNAQYMRSSTLAPETCLPASNSRLLYCCRRPSLDGTLLFFERWSVTIYSPLCLSRTKKPLSTMTRHVRKNLGRKRQHAAWLFELDTSPGKDAFARTILINIRQNNPNILTFSPPLPIPSKPHDTQRKAKPETTPKPKDSNNRPSGVRGSHLHHNPTHKPQSLTTHHSIGPCSGKNGRGAIGPSSIPPSSATCQISPSIYSLDKVHTGLAVAGASLHIRDEPEQPRNLGPQKFRTDDPAISRCDLNGLRCSSGMAQTNALAHNM
ncbi:uncharacterized protein CLUP02_11854 [Colletotrichum lupini]|uniref:Uncharacterized protein n=1 Tax=Colletotrichum lupini TaxID=145971 RepID=A0A9Q8SZ97_9PEZI|nr:uncharacterized protein CLUP02_11854 [Colletotrichum lupini]UQC86354.1 hypothetical protein CLUP02_11854 [Colletotrichum lupini]